MGHVVILTQNWDCVLGLIRHRIVQYYMEQFNCIIE